MFLIHLICVVIVFMEEGEAYNHIRRPYYGGHHLHNPSSFDQNSNVFNQKVNLREFEGAIRPAIAYKDQIRDYILFGKSPDIVTESIKHPEKKIVEGKKIIDEIVNYILDNPLKKLHIFALLKFHCKGALGKSEVGEENYFARNRLSSNSNIADRIIDKFNEIYYRINAEEEEIGKDLTIFQDKVLYCPIFNTWLSTRPSIAITSNVAPQDNFGSSESSYVVTNSTPDPTVYFSKPTTLRTSTISYKNPSAQILKNQSSVINNNIINDDNIPLIDNFDESIDESVDYDYELSSDEGITSDLNDLRAEPQEIHEYVIKPQLIYNKKTFDDLMSLNQMKSTESPQLFTENGSKGRTIKKNGVHNSDFKSIESATEAKYVTRESIKAEDIKSTTLKNVVVVEKAIDEIKQKIEQSTTSTDGIESRVLSPKPIRPFQYKSKTNDKADPITKADYSSNPILYNLITKKKSNVIQSTSTSTESTTNPPQISSTSQSMTSKVNTVRMLEEKFKKTDNAESRSNILEENTEKNVKFNEESVRNVGFVTSNLKSDILETTGNKEVTSNGNTPRTEKVETVTKSIIGSTTMNTLTSLTVENNNYVKMSTNSMTTHLTTEAPEEIYESKSVLKSYNDIPVRTSTLKNIPLKLPEDSIITTATSEETAALLDTVLDISRSIPIAKSYAVDSTTMPNRALEDSTINETILVAKPVEFGSITTENINDSNEINTIAPMNTNVTEKSRFSPDFRQNVKDENDVTTEKNNVKSTISEDVIEEGRNVPQINNVESLTKPKNEHFKEEDVEISTISLIGKELKNIPATVINNYELTTKEHVNDDGRNVLIVDNQESIAINEKSIDVTTVKLMTVESKTDAVTKKSVEESIDFKNMNEEGRNLLKNTLESNIIEYITEEGRNTLVVGNQESTTIVNKSNLFEKSIDVTTVEAMILAPKSGIVMETNREEPITLKTGNIGLTTKPKRVNLKEEGVERSTIASIVEEVKITPEIIMNNYELTTMGDVIEEGRNILMIDNQESTTMVNGSNLLEKSIDVTTVEAMIVTPKNDVVTDKNIEESITFGNIIEEGRNLLQTSNVELTTKPKRVNLKEEGVERSTIASIVEEVKITPEIIMNNYELTTMGDVIEEGRNILMIDNQESTTMVNGSNLLEKSIDVTTVEAMIVAPKNDVVTDKNIEESITFGNIIEEGRNLLKTSNVELTTKPKYVHLKEEGVEITTIDPIVEEVKSTPVTIMKNYELTTLGDVIKEGRNILMIDNQESTTMINGSNLLEKSTDVTTVEAMIVAPKSDVVTDKNIEESITFGNIIEEGRNLLQTNNFELTTTPKYVHLKEEGMEITTIDSIVEELTSVPGTIMKHDELTTLGDVIEEGRNILNVDNQESTTINEKSIDVTTVQSIIVEPKSGIVTEKNTEDVGISTVDSKAVEPIYTPLTITNSFESTTIENVIEDGKSNVVTENSKEESITSEDIVEEGRNLPQISILKSITTSKNNHLKDAEISTVNSTPKINNMSATVSSNFDSTTIAKNNIKPMTVEPKNSSLTDKKYEESTTFEDAIIDGRSVLNTNVIQPSMDMMIENSTESMKVLMTSTQENIDMKFQSNSTSESTSMMDSYDNSSKSISKAESTGMNIVNLAAKNLERDLSASTADSMEINLRSTEETFIPTSLKTAIEASTMQIAETRQNFVDESATVGNITDYAGSDYLVSSVFDDVPSLPRNLDEISATESSITTVSSEDDWVVVPEMATEAILDKKIGMSFETTVINKTMSNAVTTKNIGSPKTERPKFKNTTVYPFEMIDATTDLPKK